MSPIIIHLVNNKTHKGKVYKFYYTIVLSEMLSIKITSDNIKDKAWHIIFKEVVNEEFKRHHKYIVFITQILTKSPLQTPSAKS